VSIELSSDAETVETDSADIVEAATNNSLVRDIAVVVLNTNQPLSKLHRSELPTSINSLGRSNGAYDARSLQVGSFACGRLTRE
jgi:hypothetical protein